MEEIVNLYIEKLPEGVYLATSDDVPGLAAQGRTAIEALEIARDVAGKSMEARSGRRPPVPAQIGDSLDYPLAVPAPRTGRPAARPRRCPTTAGEA